MLKILWSQVLAGVVFFYLGGHQKICCMDTCSEEAELNKFVQNQNFVELQEKLVKYSKEPVPVWFSQWLKDTTSQNDLNIVLLYYSIRWYKDRAKSGLDDRDLGRLFKYLLFFIVILFHDTYVCFVNNKVKVENNYNFLALKMLNWFNDKLQSFVKSRTLFEDAVQNVSQRYKNTILRITKSMDVSSIFANISSASWAMNSYYSCWYLDTFYFIGPNLKTDSLAFEDDSRCSGVRKIIFYLQALIANKEFDGVKLWQELLSTNFKTIASISLQS